MSNLGIAGDFSATHQAPALLGAPPGAGCGLAGVVPPATATALGIAGLDTSGLRAAGLGVAGPNCHPVIADAQAILQPPAVPPGRAPLGDRAAHSAWRAARWFADYSYLVCPDGHGGLRWRARREAVFGPATRALPLFVDSAGYRRVLTRSAPRWAHALDTYTTALELLQPDDYAAFDDPLDRAASRHSLAELVRRYPADVPSRRLWPVWSVRWSYQPAARATFERLPGWAGRSLRAWIPRTRTQRPVPAATLETWARQAIAQALVLAGDPEFRVLCALNEQVMLGGLLGGPIPRATRHLFAAVLVRLFPGVRFWLLGCASATTVNGLWHLGLLDTVSVDGSWWIREATTQSLAYVEEGLITMWRLGGRARRRRRAPAGQLLHDAGADGELSARAAGGLQPRTGLAATRPAAARPARCGANGRPAPPRAGRPTRTCL